MQVTVPDRPAACGWIAPDVTGDTMSLPRRTGGAPSSARTRAGAARVGERRRADLHGDGAGEQQLGGVPTRRHAADADDRQVGQRGVDVVHGAHGDRVDRRPGQPPPPAPSAGRRVSGS